jgi:hypothetical protein
MPYAHEHIDDPATVATFIEQKQALEIQLAYELLDIFNNTASLIDPIRDRCHAALAAMTLTYTEYPWLRCAIDKTFCIAKVEQMRMATGLNNEHPPIRAFPALRCGSLPQMVANVDTFDIQDCCWVIRMYGEFVEQLAKFQVPPSQGAAATAAAAPVDPRHESVNAQAIVAERVKRLYRRGFQVKAHQAGVDEMHGTDGFMRNFLERARYNLHKPVDEAAARNVGHWLDNSLTNPHRFVNSLHGGISIFRPKPHDTTLKIDRVFGLMPGATISGTTTDLMYFMDTFAANERDPIYYLVAAAGIVSQGHHTMLEVAMPLTMNGWVDYSIGHYTTLMPTGHRADRPATSHAAQGVIWDALDTAENHRQNRLMLVYYDAPKAIGGCFLFDRTDARFKLLATADDNLARTFTGFFNSMWPSLEQVVEWMSHYYQ